jgi:hypothetical protein
VSFLLTEKRGVASVGTLHATQRIGVTNVAYTRHALADIDGVVLVTEEGVLTVGRGANSGGCRRTRVLRAAAYFSIRQHTSAYVSIRQHTSAYLLRVARVGRTHAVV